MLFLGKTVFQWGRGWGWCWGGVVGEVGGGEGVGGEGLWLIERVTQSLLLAQNAIVMCSTSVILIAGISDHMFILSAESGYEVFGVNNSTFAYDI